MATIDKVYAYIPAHAYAHAYVYLRARMYLLRSGLRPAISTAAAAAAAAIVSVAEDRLLAILERGCQWPILNCPVLSLATMTLSL